MEPTARESRVILVVEDERVTAVELERTLAGFGYRTLPVAQSSDEALSQVAETMPDLVIMDIHIKGEVDGIETARLLRRKFDLPVLYLTGSSNESDIERVKESEPYGYLQKPVSSVELRRAVEIALHRHRQEREVRGRWFSAVLRSIADGVIATGSDGRIDFMNGVAERLTGWDADEARGHALAEVFVIAREETPVGDRILTRRDGTKVAIDDASSPVLDQDGRVLGSVLCFRDATERRAFQSNLLLADRMVSIGLLAAGVAHEINNPLTSVLANLELAARTVNDLPLPSADVRELIEILQDAREGSDRVRQVVRDLKIFSRSEDEERSRVDIRRVLESSVRLAWNEIRHRARLVKDLGKVPHVIGSESRLGQMLLNLIVNAAQAIPEGRAEHNEIRISTRQDEAGGAVIEITDSGAGMTPEVLDKVYQPFVTNKEGGFGMGLGLSLSRRILTDLGGTLAIISNVGEGTTVTVRLPPAPPLPIEAAAHATSPEPSGERRRGRVLVIDDEESVARVLERALRPHHEVHVCLRAEEALERIAGGEHFDVIFCDLMMPQMTGMDLFDHVLLRAPAEASKIVFVTGGAFTPRGRSFLDHVDNQHVEKPFDVRQITSLVSSRVR